MNFDGLCKDKIVPPIYPSDHNFTSWQINLPTLLFIFWLQFCILWQFMVSKDYCDDDNDPDYIQFSSDEDDRKKEEYLTCFFFLFLIHQIIIFLSLTDDDDEEGIIFLEPVVSTSRYEQKLDPGGGQY